VALELNRSGNRRRALIVPIRLNTETHDAAHVATDKSVAVVRSIFDDHPVCH
jgi:hypothetical protein